jgi:hypothetical protein
VTPSLGNLPCKSFTADIAESYEAGKVRPTTCPEFSHEDGSLFRLSVTGGTIELSQTGVVVDMDGQESFTGSSSGSCTLHWSGKLFREEAPQDSGELHML